MLFDEETRAPLPVERSGPSHGGQPQAALTPRETQRRFSSDDDESIGPSLALVRRGRGVGRTDRRHARTRRRVANPFIQFEAEEGEDDESGSELESSPRAEPAKNTLPSPVSSVADSDLDSVSESDSDSDSFVMMNDNDD